jgi:hypothetical protein
MQDPWEIAYQVWDDVETCAYCYTPCNHLNKFQIEENKLLPHLLKFKDLMPYRVMAFYSGTNSRMHKCISEFCLVLLR